MVRLALSCGGKGQGQEGATEKESAHLSLSSNHRKCRKNSTNEAENPKGAVNWVHPGQDALKPKPDRRDL